LSEARPWWESAVFYQIYPRSFADTNGDGVGDLEGIRRHLDHLSWLGIDAIWICPFYRSPMADFGYDVEEYRDVDALFGTLENFDRLLAEAHERGIRVLIDWVPNHTSDRHPWFIESRSARNSPKRGWYVWRDGGSGPGGRPNNWKAAFGGDAWTFDEATGQWYLHLFLPQQPDVDWRNPELAAAMHDVLRFWLGRGVDGFRIDVVQGLSKDPAFPDDPPDLTLPHCAVNDYPDTHAVLRGIRRVVEEYGDDRLLLGEVYLLSTRQVARYFGHGDELHLAFDFTSLYAPWDALAWRGCIDAVGAELDPIDAWPTWTLSNHDNPRHRTRYGGCEARARAAAVLLLTLRGSPFLYAGEELGLEDAVVPAGRVVDPGGRDGCRAPLPWDGSAGHGWGVDDPWLPWPPEAATRNVADLQAEPASILHLYRHLLAARRESPALHGGEWDLLPSPRGVLAFERRSGDDHRVVAVNFTPLPVPVELAGNWSVQLSSAASGSRAGAPYAGTLGGDEAVLLSPVPGP
jgi:alpha-glucosidase